MIIGLTGKNGSGKGEVARILTDAGFIYYSLSDVLREELKKRGETVTRQSLTVFANQLRQKQGAGCLGRIVSRKLEDDKNYAVDSIRNPAEVEELKEKPQFYLLAVDADPKLRFQRISERKREKDPATYEAFVAQEAKESAGEKPTDQQINLTMEMADARIENEGSLDDLKVKVLQIVRTLSMESERLDWDAYFMNIAKQVALRSNCIKRKVAALLVKDQRIISTGYNGTPRGIKNCNEGGCPRCNAFGKSGADLENCICSHAEENAIVQAAYHGVNIQGSTIYSTYSPCLSCTKMIINSGIREVVYTYGYPLQERAASLLGEAGLIVRQWEKS